MLILTDGLVILLSTIQYKTRHEDYARVRQVAKDFTMYRTGKGIEERLLRFAGGETEEMHKQRVAITIVNTPDLVNSCVKPLYKVGRAPATEVFNWSEKDGEKSIDKKKQLLDYTKRFWGEKSLKAYLTKRIADFDSRDPNAFLVIDFKEQQGRTEKGSKNNPYPFEVTSKDAINYFYDNNILQFLTVLNEGTMIDPDGKEVAAEVYYHYIDNETIKATEVHKKTIETYLSIRPDVVQIEGPNPQINSKATYLWSFGKDDDKRYFELKITEHKIGFVPAKRFGTETDAETEDRTCVPVIYPAQCYFEDSIQTMSEFSVTKKLHTFPQKWQYGNKCPDCFKGIVSDGRTQCKTCNGHGTAVHGSAQDIITIPMPDELKDVIDIDLLSTYKAPNIDLIKFQEEFGFDKTRTRSINSVYGGDAYGRKQTLKTATEIDSDIDSVYDAVKAYGDNFSEIFVFANRCIAIIRGIGSGFECSHTFPADLKMQSLNSLMVDLKTAGESGAPSHIKKSIAKKITQKVYADDPREILKIETKEKFYPFPGKTETEIAFIIANGKTTRKLEALYAHFDLIISDIEFEQSQEKKDFYELDELKQRELIKTKVEQYMVEIEADDAKAAAKAFALANPTPVDTGGGGA